MLPVVFAALLLVLTWLVIMPARFSRLKNGNDTPVALVLKGIPTAAAAGVACYAAAAGGFPPYACWMALGLLVCLAADVVLAIRFVVGGGLFLLGHICYIIGLCGIQTLSVWNGLVFLLALAGLETFLCRYRSRIPDRLMAVGVSLYAVALAALLAAALPLPFAAGSRRAAGAASGAVLFVLSDATLCDNRINRRPALNQYISLGIYYTAQFLLGISTLGVL